MKYIILFLVVLAIPFSAAHAIKSPFIKFNGETGKVALQKPTPFTARHVARSFKENSKHRGRQQPGYNGDDKVDVVKKRSHQQNRRQQNFVGRDEETYNGN